MVEAARARADREGLVRFVAACLVGVLLFTLEAAAVPEPAQARGSWAKAAAIRARQQSSERAMRRADDQIRRLQRSRSVHEHRRASAIRRLDRALARRREARRKADRILDRLATARAQRDRTLLVRPSPSGRQVGDRPAVRKRVDKLRRQLARQARVKARADRRVERARQAKRLNVRHASAARIAARKRERARAEGRLSQQITLMLGVAKERAERRVSRSERRGFSRPAQGTVSQGYGCQRGSRGKHRRRTCVRFHDGIDIATRRGAVVRASADGYVAYVGWNPWDHGRRAFVVIIGHPRGIETIYAHLKPKRKVKAGQRVRRGQVIGVVGMTGRTSGAHVHWEVGKGFRTMDPRRAGR